MSLETKEPSGALAVPVLKNRFSEVEGAYFQDLAPTTPRTSLGAFDYAFLLFLILDQFAMRRLQNSFSVTTVFLGSFFIIPQAYL